MQNPSVKEQAHQLLDDLPDSTTWEDLMYRIYVRQSIEKGLHDSDIGETVDVVVARMVYISMAWYRPNSLSTSLSRSLKENSFIIRKVYGCSRKTSPSHGLPELR